MNTIARYFLVINILIMPLQMVLAADTVVVQQTSTREPNGALFIFGNSLLIGIICGLISYFRKPKKTLELVWE